MGSENKYIELSQAKLNGTLDALELDTTCDVIEKSIVINMIKEVKELLDKAALQQAKG
jgi:hypothetical protein